MGCDDDPTFEVVKCPVVKIVYISGCVCISWSGTSWKGYDLDALRSVFPVTYSALTTGSLMRKYFTMKKLGWKTHLVRGVDGDAREEPVKRSCLLLISSASKLGDFFFFFKIQPGLKF